MKKLADKHYEKTLNNKKSVHERNNKKRFIAFFAYIHFSQVT
jgi:hypothetical protein